jgi:hypothetical protein
MKWVGIGVIEHSHPQGVKLKMRGRELKTGVYWYGVLKQKDVKQVVRKTRAVCNILYFLACVCT